MWTSFMDQVAFKIGVHIGKRGLEGIYEDSTGSPVYRIVSLINGGVYIVRPTEEWALMRTLENYSIQTDDTVFSSRGFIPSPSKANSNDERKGKTTLAAKPEPFPAYAYIEYAREQNKTLQELYDEWFEEDDKMKGHSNRHKEPKTSKEDGKTSQQSDEVDRTKPPSGRFGPLPALSIPSDYVFYEPITEEEKVDSHLEDNRVKKNETKEGEKKEEKADDKSVENVQRNCGKRIIDQNGKFSFPPVKYFDRWYHDIFAIPKAKIRIQKDAKQLDLMEGEEGKEENDESLVSDDENSMLGTTNNLEIPEHTKMIQDCKNLSTLMDLLNSVDDLRAGKVEGTDAKKKIKNNLEEEVDICLTDYFDDDNIVDWNDNLSLPSSPSSSEDEDDGDGDDIRKESSSAFSQTSSTTSPASMEDEEYDHDDDNNTNNSNNKAQNKMVLLADDELSDEGLKLSEKNIVLILLKIGTLLRSSFKYRQEFYAKLYIMEFKEFLEINRRNEHLVKPALAALIAYCTKPIYQKQLHDYKIMRYVLDVFTKTLPNLPDSITIATTVDVDIRPRTNPLLLLPCLITVYSALHENEELIQIYLSEVKSLLFSTLEFACYPTLKSSKLALWCLLTMLDYRTCKGCFSNKWAKLVACVKNKFFFDNEISLLAGQIFELCTFDSDFDDGEEDQYNRDVKKIEELAADGALNSRRNSIRLLRTKDETLHRTKKVSEYIREGDNEGGMYG